MINVLEWNEIMGIIHISRNVPIHKLYKNELELVLNDTSTYYFQIMNTYIQPLGNLTQSIKILTTPKFLR